MAYYKIDNVPSSVSFEPLNQVERTLQNAKNLLLCRMGEIPYDRYRGFDHGLYDLPIEQFKSELIPELDRVMAWEPDVEVIDAEVIRDEGNSYYIEVTLEITIGE